MIPYGAHDIDEQDIAAVVEVLRSGWLTQGPKIAAFEHAFAAYVGARYAVAVANGTAALHLACAAAELGQGDGVITSPNTFVASANCALYVGATPQFVDIDPKTLNLDAQALRQRASQFGRVRAIIPVHFAGLPCDMPSIQKTAQTLGAVIIEDACHALGATYPSGERVGSCVYGGMTVFSFHPVKTIACGEGGMITTNDPQIYDRLARLRTHGIEKNSAAFQDKQAATTQGETNLWYYEMQDLGWNYRLSDLHAALGLSQLGKIDRFLARRRELVARYDRAFAQHPSIRIAQAADRSHSAHHLYVVRIPFGDGGTSRQALMSALRMRGVGSQVHYIPVSLQPYYRRRGFKPGDFPQAEQYYAEALSLPLYAGLSDAQQDQVIAAVQELLPVAVLKK